MDDRTSVGVAPKAAVPEIGPAASRRWRVTLSPINQRRWQNFKANRRGYVSLWIFLVLFVISLCAEFIANDKPFVVKYDGKTQKMMPGVYTWNGKDGL